MRFEKLVKLLLGADKQLAHSNKCRLKAVHLGGRCQLGYPFLGHWRSMTGNAAGSLP